jgi:hypothetical protein
VSRQQCLRCDGVLVLTAPPPVARAACSRARRALAACSPRTARGAEKRAGRT